MMLQICNSLLRSSIEKYNQLFCCPCRIQIIYFLSWILPNKLRGLKNEVCFRKASAIGAFFLFQTKCLHLEDYSAKRPKQFTLFLIKSMKLSISFYQHRFKKKVKPNILEMQIQNFATLPCVPFSQRLPLRNYFNNYLEEKCRNHKFFLHNCGFPMLEN